MFLSDDDMVECPYNTTHRMLRRRLQRHLHKCRLNYPDVELRKCPFNITHLVPEPEYVHHATNCPDRKLITQYKYESSEPKEEEVPRHAPIECDEDWDDTNVNDYNPRKYLENAKIIKKPDAVNVNFIKKERKHSDDSSEDESKPIAGLKGKSRSPHSYKRCKSNDDDNDSERSHRSKSYGSSRSRRSRSPATSSYSRKHSPKFERSRSNSPDDYRKSNRNDSSSRRRSNYSRAYSPPTNSSGRTLYSYDPDLDPYYNGGKCDDTNNSSSMPEAPPPPMISYPAPRSYSTTKYRPSSSDY